MTPFDRSCPQYIPIGNRLLWVAVAMHGILEAARIATIRKLRLEHAVI
jgi:hypothetical protein